MDRLPELAVQSRSATLSQTPAAPKSFALLHIPKCAGTSLMDAIALELGPGPRVSGFDRSLFGDFTQFDDIPKMMRSVTYLDPADMPADAATVMGHFAYSTLRGRYPDANLAMFLREPTARLLSHWVYWRSLTWSSLRHWGAAWSARLKLARLPLHDFLLHPDVACQTDNIMTRMLVWPHRLIPDNGFIDPADDAALLAIAAENLQACGFAGMIERGPPVYREFAGWLGIKLDLPTLNPARKMRRAARTQLSTELSPATLALLEARSRIDTRLWRTLAARNMTEADAGDLRKTVILQAVARFSALLT